jgi:hypothetical protein
MLMREHGLRIFAGGLVLHGDRRRRFWSKDGVEEFVKHKFPRRGRRGRVRAFSEASRKRLELIAASAVNGFRSLLTLTYHALAEAWEEDAERNARVVQRSKRDLNRFLTVMRAELGAYVWIQEFQTRGVVHYHLLCEDDVEESRASLAWCRATGEMDDDEALRHAVKCQRSLKSRPLRSPKSGPPSWARRGASGPSGVLMPPARVGVLRDERPPWRAHGVGSCCP